MIKAIVSASIWFSFIVFSCFFVQFCLHGGKEAFSGDPGFAIRAAYISTAGFFAGYFVRK